MTDIDGNLVTMAGSFGTLGFGTLEPGSGILEEQISFTGITQNANGTATLTGVSSVAFASPYTKTSGLLKTHAGSVVFVISNTSGFYDTFVNKNDDETVTGTITFTAPNYPQIDVAATVPTLPAQFATLQYVNSVAVAGAPNATTLTKGIVQIATQAQVDAKTLIGSTSATLVQPLNTQRSTLLSDYIVDAGSPNVIILTPSPALTAYTAGQQLSFKALYSNTSPTISINANGLGAKNLSLNGSVSPNIGDITLGQMITVEYDGTNFQITSPVLAPTGTISMFGGATAPGGYVLCDGTSYLRSTYPNLFNVIGVTFGNVDGSHFNVPSLGGRFVAGPSASISTTIGAVGGALTNTFTPSVTTSAGNVAQGSDTSRLTGAGGQSQTISITPPYMILNYIIKV